MQCQPWLVVFVYQSPRQVVEAEFHPQLLKFFGTSTVAKYGATVLLA
jgi:hypothetical protein